MANLGLSIDLEIDDESTNTISVKKDETEDAIIIEKLSDEDDSEYDLGSDILNSNVDQILDMNDIMKNMMWK